MQSAREVKSKIKPGEALRLSGRFKRKTCPGAELSCIIPVILDGSFNVSPSEHVSPKLRQHRNETQISEAVKRYFLNWSMGL